MILSTYASLYQCIDQCVKAGSGYVVDFSVFAQNLISYCGCSFHAESTTFSLANHQRTVYRKAKLSSDSFIHLQIEANENITSLDATSSVSQLFTTNDESRSIYRTAIPSYLIPVGQKRISAQVPSPKCEHVIGQTCSSILKLTLKVQLSSYQLILTEYIEMEITGDECQTGLAAGDQCWYNPTSNVETLALAQLTCQQTHSSGHLPKSEQINHLRSGFINDAFDQLNHDEFWAQNYQTQCFKWYSYNVDVKPTQCQLKHAVLCVTPPPHRSPPLPVMALNMKRITEKDTIITWTHNAKIDNTVGYELHQVIDSTQLSPTTLQLRLPLNQERVVYNDILFKCPPFAPVRLFLDMSHIFDRSKRAQIEASLKDFKQKYFTTNITSTGRGQKTTTRNQNLENFLIRKRIKNDIGELQKMLDDVNDKYWINLDFVVHVDNGIKYPELSIKSSHLAKVTKFVELTLTKDLHLPKKSLLKLFCSFRTKIDLSLAIRAVDNANNYGKFSFPIQIPGIGVRKDFSYGP